MQNISQRTNPTLPEASANANVIPVPRPDGATREFVRKDAAPLRRDPETTTQVVADINSFVERVAGVSLSELQNVILELQHLHDFLHNEGERIQRELSTYLQLTQTAIGSTRTIANNIVDWKEVADSTAQALEKRRAEPERANAKGVAEADAP
jgi:hypothetical protein